MARDQTNDIEQTVRNVLSEVLSEVSDEMSSSASDSGIALRARGSPKPPGGDPDKPDIPPEVLAAVEDVCSELSPEQASALASLFEAIADLGEEEPDDEPEQDEGIGAKADTALELSSEASAQAEGEKIAAKGVSGALRLILRLLKKSKPLLSAAVRAAKKGHRTFMKWVNGLSNFNPVKWAIKALPTEAVLQLMDMLVNAIPSRAAPR